MSATILLRRRPLQFLGKGDEIDISRLTTNFEHRNYLDDIVAKWTASGKIFPSTPINVAYSMAFSLEHPWGMDKMRSLENYLETHKARTAGKNQAVHSLSIAYGSYINHESADEDTSIKSTYGTNATTGSQNTRRTEHAWRRKYAYPEEWYSDGVPTSVVRHRANTQWAEMISLPSILRSIEGIPSGTPIVIVSLTIDADTKLPKKMCPNCMAFAKRMTQIRLGLSIVDAGIEPSIIHESVETVRILRYVQFH